MSDYVVPLTPCANTPCPNPGENPDVSTGRAYCGWCFLARCYDSGLSQGYASIDFPSASDRNRRASTLGDVGAATIPSSDPFGTYLSDSPDATVNAYGRHLLTAQPTQRALAAPQADWDSAPTVLTSSGSPSLDSQTQSNTRGNRSTIEPLTSPRPADSASSQHSTDCCICLQALTSEPSIELQACGHKFHEHCMNRWAAETPSWRNTPCPYCRREIV